MATPPSTQPQDPQQLPPPPLKVDLEGQTKQALKQEIEVVDFSKRAQWLRATVLGANDGLLSPVSLMMGAGAVHKDVKTMAITGVAELIAGACSMAIGELVSMYSQYDIEVAQMKREDKNGSLGIEEMDARKEKLPSPWKAVGASALAFAVGALVPLLAAVFIKGYQVSLVVVTVAVSMALVGFGGLSTVLGKHQW
ncbi:vacuolar iron transporter homolog 1-like [Syzygium oleosum]|uniref:vacuolar iron transporter homolog 1-like n=1 Tax=Syzygium oleosum TaxID=219896 RepID=UPI0024B9B22C|nr:vacuolar iron transporter homolog 1-like [Syzygium oleosum]